MTAWTRVVPSKVGWYWWRDLSRKHYDDQGPHIYFVRDYAGRLSIGNCSLDGSHFARGEWQGPIEPEA